jgi:hypothetical protein
MLGYEDARSFKSFNCLHFYAVPAPIYLGLIKVFQVLVNLPYYRVPGVLNYVPAYGQGPLLDLREIVL